MWMPQLWRLFGGSYDGMIVRSKRRQDRGQGKLLVNELDDNRIAQFNRHGASL